MFNGGQDLGRPSALIEYAIKYGPINFQMIYIGSHFDNLPTKIAPRKLAHAAYSSETRLLFEKVLIFLASSDADKDYSFRFNQWWEYCFEMTAKIVGDGNGGKYLSCWQ